MTHRPLSSAHLVVDRRLVPSDLPGFSARIGELLGAGDELMICDVSTVLNPDLGTLDALARLQLHARRHGGRIELDGVSPALLRLLHLTGLSRVLPLRSGVQVHRQAEEREEPLGVEEERELDDPSAGDLQNL